MLLADPAMYCRVRGMITVCHSVAAASSDVISSFCHGIKCKYLFLLSPLLGRAEKSF